MQHQIKSHSKSDVNAEQNEAQWRGHNRNITQTNKPNKKTSFISTTGLQKMIIFYIVY